jgi:endonuclease/exonuclease/phosphatase family metal-dependent hydrolase
MGDIVFKVLTYNIHKGFSIGNRRFVLHRIRDALISADTDVVFLQELLGEHRHHEQRVSDWPEKSQFEFLADTVWPHHAYGKNAIYDVGHHGNAILSKFPFDSWQNIKVSVFKKASRSLLHGVIRIPGCKVEIHVICIHFCLLAFERRRQLRLLSDHIHSHVPSGAPLVIAGDFNDWTERADRHLCSEPGLREVFRNLEGNHARTFPANFPILPMDRIYYRGLQPISCQRLLDHPWQQLSDHAPLSASFALPSGSSI